ncbi:hypothetical protein T492DRAFT_976610 [Pavlovales sp. CCMP2436]|nr:hypothetical protein T492DRAFT_976610 [Pavlovales sp. CCMP2436]
MLVPHSRARGATEPTTVLPVVLHYISGLDQLFVNCHPGAHIRLLTGVFKVVAYEMTADVSTAQLQAYRDLAAKLHVSARVQRTGSIVVGARNVRDADGTCAECLLPVAHVGATHAHTAVQLRDALACAECPPGVDVRSCPRSSLKLCAYRSWHRQEGTNQFCAFCPTLTPREACPVSECRLRRVGRLTGGGMTDWARRIAAARVVRVPPPARGAEAAYVESRGEYDDHFEWCDAARAAPAAPAAAVGSYAVGRVRWERSFAGCTYLRANGRRGLAVAADSLLAECGGLGFSPFQQPHRDELPAWRWRSAVLVDHDCELLRPAADVLRWRLTRKLGCAMGDVLVQLVARAGDGGVDMWVADKGSAGFCAEALRLDGGLGPFARFATEPARGAAPPANLLCVLDTDHARRAQRDHLEAELLEFVTADLEAHGATTLSPLAALLHELDSAWVPGHAAAAAVNQ